jgi:hypothetical protein
MSTRSRGRRVKPPIGRLAAAAAVARRRPGPRPSAGADSEKPSGPPKHGQRRGRMVSGCAGSRPAASWARGVAAMPRRSADYSPRWLGSLPPAGISGPGMAGASRARRGGWVVARPSRPPSTRGKPSRPPPGPPASVRASRSVRRGGLGGGPLPRRVGRWRTGWLLSRRGDRHVRTSP